MACFFLIRSSSPFPLCIYSRLSRICKARVVSFRDPPEGIRLIFPSPFTFLLSNFFIYPLCFLLHSIVTSRPSYLAGKGGSLGFKKTRPILLKQNHGMAYIPKILLFKKFDFRFLKTRAVTILVVYFCANISK